MKLSLINNFSHKNYYPRCAKESNCTAVTRKSANANALSCLAVQNLAFLGKHNIPLYVINYDGSYKRYEKRKDIQNELGINQSSIVSGIRTLKPAVGKIICKEEDILNPKTREIAPEKLRKVIDGFAFLYNAPVYAFNLKEIKRFDSMSEAAEHYNFPYDAVLNTANGEINKYNGYVFIRANDVELRDESGKLIKDENENPVLDIKKINKLKEVFLDVKKDVPLLCIDKDSNISIIYGVKTFTDMTKIDPKIICDMYTNHFAKKGYTCAKLKDVVARDENEDVIFKKDGNYMLDYSKIEKIYNRAFGYDSNF